MITDLISLEWVTPLLSAIGGMWVFYQLCLVLDEHQARKRLEKEREYLRKNPRDPNFPPVGSL